MTIEEFIIELEKVKDKTMLVLIAGRDDFEINQARFEDQNYINIY